MRKIIFSLAGATVLICGCNKPNPDSAKIEELSKKVDALLRCQLVIYTNESIIFNEIAAVKTQVTNLPNWNAMNDNAYFYHTNMANLVSLQAQNILSAIFEQGQRIEKVQSAQSDMQASLRQIDTTTWGTWFMLTNFPPVTGKDMNQIELESNVEQVKDDVGEVGEIREDLRKIKIKLGIVY